MLSKKNILIALAVLGTAGLLSQLLIPADTETISAVSQDRDQSIVVTTAEPERHLPKIGRKEERPVAELESLKNEVLQAHNEEHHHDHDEFGNLPHDCQESIRIAQENAEREALEGVDDVDTSEVDAEILAITQKVISESEDSLTDEFGNKVDAQVEIAKLDAQIKEFEEAQTNGDIEGIK